jgi:hypothetical protein
MKRFSALLALLFYFSILPAVPVWSAPVIQDLIVKESPWVDVRSGTIIPAGDNVTDDMAAIQAAATAASGGTLWIPKPSVAYKVTGSITLPSNITIVGSGRPSIYTSSTTLPMFTGDVINNWTISGLRLQGGGSGGAAGDLGLININAAVANGPSDVRIYDCEISNFRNLISAIRVDHLWIQRNHLHNFKVYGVLASGSYDFHIDHNNIHDCDSTDTTNAYGVQATGENAAGKPSKQCSISFNNIANIPSWDAVMTHDISNLVIMGNNADNVRTGYDVSKGLDSNIIENVRIIGNYAKATTTDTHLGAAATHDCIHVIGRTGSQINGVVVAENICEGFFNATGLVTSGDSGTIVLEYLDNVAVGNNVVKGSGTLQQSAGLMLAGNINNFSLNGGSLQGKMASGGIRLSAVVGSNISLGGFSIDQDSTSDFGVYISGSTITNFALGEFNSNSVAGSEFITATSTINQKGAFYSGSSTVDPSSLADGAQYFAAITCAGAVLGDFVSDVSFSLDLQKITLTAYVSSANTVTAVFQNESGGVVDLGSGTLRVRVRPGL